jgi:hypothetical protein
MSSGTVPNASLRKPHSHQPLRVHLEFLRRRLDRRFGIRRFDSTKVLGLRASGVDLPRREGLRFAGV